MLETFDRVHKREHVERFDRLSVDAAVERAVDALLFAFGFASNAVADILRLALTTITARLEVNALGIRVAMRSGTIGILLGSFDLIFLQLYWLSLFLRFRRRRRLFRVRNSFDICKTVKI